MNITDKRGYIAAVGTVCVDEYFDASGWLPEGGSRIVEFSGRAVGGMIANAACVAAAYGDKACLLDIMGDTEQTAFIREDLERSGVDISHIRTVRDLADARCLVVRTPGDRTIFVVDRHLYSRTLSEADRELLMNASYIYSSFQEFEKFRNFENLAAELKMGGARLAFDMDATAFTCDSRLFAYADILFFNRLGYEKFLAGAGGEEAVSRFLHGDSRVVVVTDAANGLTLRHQTECLRIPGVPVEAVDATGAGDTFNASFLHGMLAGWNLQKCAEFANCSAAYAVTRRGPRGGAIPLEQAIAQYERHYGRPV